MDVKDIQQMSEDIDRFKAAQDAEILRLFLLGVTYQKCAEFCGVPIHKVQAVVTKAGVLRRQQLADILKEVK